MFDHGGSPVVKVVSYRPVVTTRSPSTPMKRKLLALAAFACLATASSNATQFWYDPITNLSLGCLTTNSPSVNLTVTNFSNWYPHGPGSAFNGTPYDMLIVTNTYTSGAAQSSKRLRVDGTKS